MWKSALQKPGGEALVVLLYSADEIALHEQEVALIWANKLARKWRYSYCLKSAIVFSRTLTVEQLRKLMKAVDFLLQSSFYHSKSLHL